MTQVRIMELRGTYKGGGGPDKTILLSAAKHDEKRFFVLVTYLRDPGDDEFQIGAMAEQMGVRDYVEVLDRSALDLRCLFQLSRLVRDHSLQIVHVHDLKTTLMGVLLKLLNPKIRIMHTAHGWVLNSGGDRLKQKLQFLLLKCYPLHIAVSRATKQLMVTNGIRPERVTVLHNTIDIDFWKRQGRPSTLRKELNIPEECLVIGTVGRLSREKDLPVFFGVARNILRSRPDTRFLVVGDGRGAIGDELRTLAADMGIGGAFVFTGHRTDLPNVYLAFDLFLMTSLTEGLPNTVLEAMALALPVVATRVGGVPELVQDGVTGLLCERRDVQGLTAAVEDLMRNGEKRALFGANGRRVVEETFSFVGRLRRIEEIYGLFGRHRHQE